MSRVRERDGVWQAVCYHWAGTKRKLVVRSTGVRVDGSHQAKQTAERIARDIEASLAAGQGLRARGTSLRAAYEALAEKKRVAGRSAATLDITAEKAVHVLRFFEKRDAESLTDKDFLEYAQYATKKRIGPTVARELRELCLALKAVGVKPPTVPELGKSKARTRWLTEPERRALLEQIMPRWREHVVMYLQLGLSKSELFKLRAEHVDLERNVLSVPGTKTTARVRTLPMPADVRAIIQRRLSSARERGQQLFESWNPGNADRHLRLAGERAGLGPISFNDLRRTFATALAREGFSALQLRPLMGHASTRMLDAHYARMGLGQDAQHIVDALPMTPADERAVRTGRERGVPAWNKGKPRRHKYVTRGAVSEGVTGAAESNEEAKSQVKS